MGFYHVGEVYSMAAPCGKVPTCDQCPEKDCNYDGEEPEAEQSARAAARLALKQRALGMLTKGGDILAIADALGVHPRTLSRWKNGK